MRFFDKATEDFFKAFFTKQITHGGDAEKFSFVRVKSSSSDYFNHCRFIYISAIGAAFDQLPPVPLPIADGSLQGIFFNVRCPRDQAIEFAEDAFNLFVFQKRGKLEVMSSEFQIVFGSGPALELCRTYTNHHS